MAVNNIKAYKAVGGAFFKQALRTSPLILLMALLFVSCEKELFHYAEITEYHAESQQLDVSFFFILRQHSDAAILFV